MNDKIMKIFWLHFVPFFPASFILPLEKDKGFARLDDYWIYVRFLVAEYNKQTFH